MEMKKKRVRGAAAALKGEQSKRSNKVIAAVFSCIAATEQWRLSFLHANRGSVVMASFISARYMKIDIFGIFNN